jgi:hypothetical protein
VPDESNAITVSAGKSQISGCVSFGGSVAPDHTEMEMEALKQREAS